jgi:hypothetical protein
MKHWIALLLVTTLAGACKNQEIAEGVVELRREELYAKQHALRR